MMDQIEQAKTDARATLVWHFLGLAFLLVGAFFLGGLPAVLLCFGVWLILATMFDEAGRRRA